MKLRKFPNALAIMLGFILIAGMSTYLIPTGQFERVTDEDLGYEKVVPGSYATFEAEPMPVYRIFMAIPEGIIEGVDLITLILLLGGCFYVIEKTGALKAGINLITQKLRGKESLTMILVALMFATGGALIGLQEEIIALTPLLLLFTSKMGYDAFVAIGISFGAALVGGAFSPVNPFAVVVAQESAGLPFLSGFEYRLVILLLAFAFWMFIVLRYAKKTRVQPVEDTMAGEEEKLDKRGVIILVLVGLAFAVVVYGMIKLGWGFNEMSALFFTLGFTCGLVGKLGINGTSVTYVEGFKEMIFACVLVGLARSISLLLQEGQIIDTVIYGLFLPMQYLPSQLSAIAMMLAQAVLHMPVPSYSGQAVLTMPILAPLSDLIGLSRQVTVLSYQTGAVMADMLIPTNGALMAIISIAGVSYAKWFKFILKPFLLMLAFAGITILVGIYIGF